MAGEAKLLSEEEIERLRAGEEEDAVSMLRVDNLGGTRRQIRGWRGAPCDAVPHPISDHIGSLREALDYVDRLLDEADWDVWLVSLLRVDGTVIREWERDGDDWRCCS